MLKWLVISAIVIRFKVDGLTCNEGINVTLLGLPFYHWSERECFGISNCFTQEISLELGVHVSMRYGGCISKYYSSQFTCNKLFSNDSNFNPSILLNIVTDSDDFVESVSEDFRRNPSKYFQQLFSSGGGAADFVDGAFNMLGKTFGLNLKEMRKLRQPIIDFVATILRLPTDRSGRKDYLKDVWKKRDDLYTAIGDLDINQDVSQDKLYSFISGVDGGANRFHDAIKLSIFRPTFEKFPSLLRSMFKEQDQALKWFDSFVNGLSKINAQNLTQSTNDMTNEIIKSVTMPTYGKQLTKYVINSFLQCVDGRFWLIPSVKDSIAPYRIALLKYGDPDNYTVALTNRVTKLTTILSPNPALLKLIQLIETTSNSLQYLFRTFAPIPTSELNGVYKTLIDGFDSLNYTNIAHTKPLGKTKMSEFIYEVLRRTKLFAFVPPHIENVVINLSKTFYKVMTSKYEKELDTFFTTLTSGFFQSPKLKLGMIVKDLFRNFGHEVPASLKPLLDNIQPIIDTHNSPNFFERDVKLTAALKILVSAYKSAFPASKFPPIAMRYVAFVEKQLSRFMRISFLLGRACEKYRTTDQNYFQECMEGVAMRESFQFLNFTKEVTNMRTDLFFAIMESTGLTSDSFIKKALASNWTAVAAYARLMKSLDPEDVKELQNDYDVWFKNLFHVSNNYNFDNFILAVNYTTDKITRKLAKVMKDLRYVHAPESCRHVTCEGNNCNTHDLLSNVSVITKAMMRGEAPKSSKDTTGPTGGFALYVKPNTGLFITLVLVSISWSNSQ